MGHIAGTGCHGHGTLAETTQAHVGSYYRCRSCQCPRYKQSAPCVGLRGTIQGTLLPPRTNVLLHWHRSDQAEDSRRTRLPRQHCVAGAADYAGCHGRRRVDRRSVTPRSAGTAARGNGRRSVEIPAATGTGCRHSDRGHGPGDISPRRNGSIQRIDCRTSCLATPQRWTSSPPATRPTGGNPGRPLRQAFLAPG